jgi:hypothetical protein
MNLAVKFWQDIENPKALPGHWPSECLEIGDETTYDDGSGYVWTIMSVEQYNAYVASHQAEYDAWSAANPPPALP